MKILIDTREQEMLGFEPGLYIDSVERRALPFGDYACEINGTVPNVYFERKSIADLWGTLTTGINRFKAEVQMALEANASLYLIIEGTMSDVYKGYEFSQVFGSQIIRTIFTYKIRYSVEPVFCPDRDTMRYYMIETFEAIMRNMKKEDSN